MLRVDEDGFRVTVDRLGTVHAYRGPSGAGSCFKSLWPGPAQLDWWALAGFFSHGFFPADRTYHPDVRILEPASHHELSRGGVWRRQRYWTWRHEPNDRPYGQVLDEFIERMRELIDEIDVGRLAVPISGGLDSRLTVAALAPERAGRWAFSYGYGPRSVETRIARALASRRRLPFTEFEVPTYLFQEIDRVLDSVEGFQDITQSRQLGVADALRRNADTVVAAHWGDVWLDDMGFDKDAAELSSSALVDHVLSRIQKRGRAWLLEHLCRPHVAQPEEALRGWVESALSSYGEIEDPDFRVKAFKTDHWSFRWTLASVRAYEVAATPKLLFYDPRLVDFFLRLPTDYVARRRLEIGAIKRLAPDLARVRWQAFDASLYTWHLHDSLHLPRRAIKKLWRLARREKVLQRNWEVQFGGSQGRRDLRRHLLEPGLRLHDWVSIRDVEALLRDFFDRPDGANGYTVSMLLTFALRLERP